MKSYASLAQLPNSLDGLRNRIVEIIAAENELMALHQQAAERLAKLAAVECELQNEFLFPAVARFGDDFDAWWQDLPVERIADVFDFIDTLLGRPVPRKQAEHVAWSLYMDAYHIIDNARGAA